MKTDLNKLEELYPEMPSIPSDIEISQNAVMKPIAEISQLLGVKSNERKRNHQGPTNHLPATKFF